MGRRRKILGLVLAMVLYAQEGMLFNAYGQESQVMDQEEERIEQVYGNLPEVVMYASGLETADVQEAEAYLAGEKLSLINTGVFSELDEGIYYYVLLDISGSIPDRYFSGIKEGILNLQNSLGEKDRLVLCTFGETVALAADGSQTPGELEEILAALDNGDQKTLLFEGIDRAASLASQVTGEQCHRKVLAVISDGEDIAVGKKMAEEAQETLKETGLPAYAFAIRDTASANINSFGQFARTSGGDLTTFTSDQGPKILTDLAAELQQDVYGEYEAASNVVTNQEETFSLKFSDGRVMTRPVMNVHWIPDEEAPYLVQGERIGQRQIRLTFSEPMEGLEGAANYQVAYEGEPVGVTGVAYDREDNTQVTLTLEEEVKNGTYSIGCSNITDVSMEKNPLSGNLSVEITSVPEPETEPEAETEAVPPEKPENYTGVLFLLFAAVVALAVVLAVRAGKKKPKDDESKGAGKPEETNLRPDDFKQHVKMEPGDRLPVEAVISVNGRKPVKTLWQLEKSLIVGRASICDVYFDDGQMSRQHFCLEREGKNILISDLQSTNGTSVNGIAVGQKRRLSPGDVIEAGSVKITVRW